MKTKEYWSTTDDFKGSEDMPDGIVMLQQLPPEAPTQLQPNPLHPDMEDVCNTFPMIKDPEAINWLNYVLTNKKLPDHEPTEPVDFFNFEDFTFEKWQNHALQKETE